MSEENLNEPVLNEKDEPSWLTRHYEKRSIRKPGPVKKMLETDAPLIDVPMFTLKSQCLWHCQKCGTLINSNPSIPLECYEDQGGCGRTSTFKPYTKLINPDIWKLPHWEDIPDTTGIYQDFYEINKRCVIFVEDIQYKIYTLDIISSYFMDEWETIGYQAFIGLIESGKSRALDLIAETGWRMINAGSGVSFPAMVRGTHLYGAGILFDEADDKLSNKTEMGQQMLSFLKPGYRRGSHYVTADKEDPERILSYKNYGFKAFAGEKGFDRAMMSRCKIFEMEQDYPEIQNLKDIREKLNQIQTKLLNLKYRRNTPIPQTPDDIGINGRNLEIFNPTIRTALFLGIDYQDIIDYAKRRKEEEIEDLKETDEWSVLNAIKNGEENSKLFDAPETLSYNEIIGRLSWEDIVINGKTKSPNQRLGYVLKKLQLKSKHMTEGTVLLLNDKKNDRKLKYLYRRYKV